MLSATKTYCCLAYLHVDSCVLTGLLLRAANARATVTTLKTRSSAVANVPPSAVSSWVCSLDCWPPRSHGALTAARLFVPDAMYCGAICHRYGPRPDGPCSVHLTSDNVPLSFLLHFLWCMPAPSGSSSFGELRADQQFLRHFLAFDLMPSPFRIPRQHGSLCWLRECRNRGPERAWAVLRSHFCVPALRIVGCGIPAMPKPELGCMRGKQCAL